MLLMKRSLVRFRLCLMGFAVEFCRKIGNFSIDLYNNPLYSMYIVKKYIKIHKINKIN